MWSWALLILFLGGCVLLMWLSRRIEPHWVSKDGQQFTCRVAELHAERGEVGSWDQARVAVNGDDGLTVAVKPKLFRMPGSRAPIRMLRVEGRTDSDRSGLVVYLLSGEEQMALRVPKKSRAVDILDDLAAHPG
jgi:hypothetical protein